MMRVAPLPWRSRWMLAPAVTCVLLMALAGCSGTHVDSPGSASNLYITMVKPADRKVAPVLEGKDIGGAALSTADYRGKTLVVNLWGPWCGPCRAEAPVMKQISEKYADKGVQFIGMVNDSGSQQALAFNRKAGIAYPSFADLGGQLELGFAKSLPAQGVPTTWIIDSDGRVAARIMDPRLRASTLSGVIDDVLADST